MYSAASVIRAYDTTADTVTVELTCTGVIHTWLDGIAMAASIPRITVVPGADCTLHLRAAARLCGLLPMPGVRPDASEERMRVWRTARFFSARLHVPTVIVSGRRGLHGGDS